ncbi:hypothetical protein Bca4012_070921 [Brassica carinata]|uniref:Uncharacterized protein n=1 Tax=Brassica oleracea var. oleracea TaxID=109376 RepID=A0A0D3CB79_BRAOL
MISFSFVDFVYVCWCIAGHNRGSYRYRTMFHRHRQADCLESSSAALVIQALKEPERDRKKFKNFTMMRLIFHLIISLRLLG